MEWHQIQSNNPIDEIYKFYTERDIIYQYQIMEITNSITRQKLG